MEKAIKTAIEGGWKPEYADHKIHKAYRRAGSWAKKGNTSSFIDWGHAFLDPLFWQALGKAMGWWDGKKFPKWHPKGEKPKAHWQIHMQSFIDHLIAGKSPDLFFMELLSGNK